MADKPYQPASPVMPAARRCRFALRIVIFLYFVALTCPIQFFCLADYLDLSWVLAINMAADQSLKYGEDIFWTYGPFAYLSSPLPIGNNLSEALSMQLALWAAAALVAADLFFVQSLRLSGLAALAFSTAVSWPMLHFNFGGAENLIALLAYLLIASSLCCRNWLPRFVPAALACGLAAMFKFSAAVGIAGGLIGATAVMMYRSRRQGLAALAVAISVACVSCIGSYWLHNPSWDGLKGYFWGAHELSAGYSAAMSKTEFPVATALSAATLLSGLIAVFVIGLLREKDRGAALIGVFLLPLALGWKHLIVRLDELHLALFFSLAAFCLGTMLAFHDRSPHKPVLRWVVFALGAAISLMFVQFAMLHTLVWTDPVMTIAATYRKVFTATAALGHLPRALDTERTAQELLRTSTARLKGSRLPDQVCQRIGESPVGFFGSHYAFASIDGLNLRLPPIPQIYSAYTPPLDQLCADWYREKAPDHLLLTWKAIDNRHPLTQAPRTWLEVWRWYDAEFREGEWLLLIRRDEPRFGRPVSLGSFPAFDGQAISVQSTHQPLLVSVRRPLSLSGRLLEGLFRVPPVAVRYERDDGSSVERRAILAVADYPTLIRPLPFSLDEAAQLLSPEPVSVVPDRIRSFSFRGAEGYYVDKFEVEFYTLGSVPDVYTGRSSSGHSPVSSSTDGRELGIFEPIHRNLLSR